MESKKSRDTEPLKTECCTHALSQPEPAQVFNLKTLLRINFKIQHVLRPKNKMFCKRIQITMHHVQLLKGEILV